MTFYFTYATSTHTAQELAALITDLAGLVFTERDSYYRGIYFDAAQPDGTRVQVQPNTIPGDDDQHDFYEPDHPEASALVLITTPDPDHHLQGPLAAIHDLNRLT